MIKKIKSLILKDTKFIIIPEVQKDELLSSWFVRTAYAHHTHPQTFFNLHFGLEKREFLRRDIDVVTNDEFIIRTLLKKTENKINILSLTLKKYTDNLYENEIMNSANRTFISNMKFCPNCLKEDKIAYFRKSWKMIFITTCTKHNCFLYDACPECNNIISVTKMYQDKKSFIYCNKCGFDLRKSKNKIINNELFNGIKAQKRLMSILDKGYIRFKNNWVYSFVFFITIIQITKLIFLRKHIKYIDKNPLFKLLQDKFIKNTKISPPVFNRLYIQELFALFGLIMYIFDNYPKNFQRYMGKNELTHWDMVKEIKFLSFWYDKLVNDISPRYIAFGDFITKEEIENAKKYLKSRGKDITKANLQRLFCTYNYFFKFKN